jgi:methionine aminopeptidase
VGAEVSEVCAFGDREIMGEVQKVYNNKKGITKGIAFPTCVSPNQIAGHFSPLKSEIQLLQDGDIVKM